MDILGLGVKEYGLLPAQAAVKQSLSLADGGTDFQLVPELLVGIELYQVVSGDNNCRRISSSLTTIWYPSAVASFSRLFTRVKGCR